MRLTAAADNRKDTPMTQQPEPVHEGRIVYYEDPDDGSTLAGIVTAVHGDGTTVDLQGVRDGQPVDVADVPFAEEPTAGSWSWHPDEPPAEP